MRVDAPPIVVRSVWRANPLVTPAGSIGVPAPELWLHHTAAMGLHGSSGMRILQANAISRGYADFEYWHLVDNPNAVIYESRGTGKNSAATYQHNTISGAVVVAGNFEIETPSNDVLNSCAHLAAWYKQNNWTKTLFTGPHRDASGNSTACCGRNLIAMIPEINRRAQALLDGPGPTPVPPPEEEEMKVYFFRVPDAGTPEGKKEVFMGFGCFYCLMETKEALDAHMYIHGVNTIGTLTKKQIGWMQRVQADHLLYAA